MDVVVVVVVFDGLLTVFLSSVPLHFFFLFTYSFTHDLLQLPFRFQSSFSVSLIGLVVALISLSSLI